MTHVKRVAGLLRGLAALFAVAGFGAGCEPEGPAGYAWDLPPGIPPPRVPDDNPMSDEKVELGRYLFHDVRLSGNETQSCAGCHRQADAFTDGRAVSIGSTGEPTPRNSMSLANVAYVAQLTWANPALVALEDQALVPMFGDHPVELGLSGMEDVLLARLALDPMYPSMFRAAFPDDPEPLRVTNAVRAIASFERTLLSFDAPYDRAGRGEPGAMNAAAARGQELFFSERMECFHCHSGFTLSDSTTHTGQPLADGGLHNTGLYNIDGRGAYPAPNRGLFEHTGDPRDMGRFRAPTLRNIALTAPYMHDGSIATLEEVLDHYAEGGRTIERGPFAGVGADSPLKSIFMHGFTLTDAERDDVLAFLRGLTDTAFIEDPRFSSPFPP